VTRDRDSLFYRPGNVRAFAWILFVLGTAGAVGLGLVHGAGRIWPIYLANLLFWSGISLGSVVFSAIIEITDARWGRPFKRIAEAAVSFLPVSLLLFVIVTIWGRGTLGWNAHEIRRIWLTMPFLAIRDLFSLALLYGVALYYVYLSLRPDVGRLTEEGRDFGRLVRLVVLAGWKGTGPEVERRRSTVRVYAPILVFLYCVIQTLIGIDYVMALDPEWFSTLFGGYFFMGHLYMALAFIGFASICLSDSMQLDEIRPDHLHSLGKLLFGICLVVGDFFWSQFLVIWYGNLPEETGFIILRIKDAPWAPLGWTVLAVAFVLPFVSLISRKLKMTGTGLLAVSSVVLTGMWLEKFLLVVPSILHPARIPIGLVEVCVTAAFAGIFIIGFTDALRFFPVLPVTDPLFQENRESGH
jgi:Ni/Fe-hydrogenase subunit HybB-like protein